MFSIPKSVNSELKKNILNNQREKIENKNEFLTVSQISNVISEYQDDMSTLKENLSKIINTIQKHSNDNSLDNAKLTSLKLKLLSYFPNQESFCRKLISTIVSLATHRHHFLSDKKVNWFGNINKTESIIALEKKLGITKSNHICTFTEDLILEKLPKKFHDTKEKSDDLKLEISTACLEAKKSPERSHVKRTENLTVSYIPASDKFNITVYDQNQNPKMPERCVQVAYKFTCDMKTEAIDSCNHFTYMKSEVQIQGFSRKTLQNANGSYETIWKGPYCGENIFDFLNSRVFSEKEKKDLIKPILTHLLTVVHKREGNVFSIRPEELFRDPETHELSFFENTTPTYSAFYYPKELNLYSHRMFSAKRSEPEHLKEILTHPLLRYFEIIATCVTLLSVLDGREPRKHFNHLMSSEILTYIEKVKSIFSEILKEQNDTLPEEDRIPFNTSLFEQACKLFLKRKIEPNFFSDLIRDQEPEQIP